jgi:DNA-binding ferritin-like protein (Dps family)
MERRDPAAVFAAHELDPARRTLYVEGRSDRAFLTWLVAPTRDPDAMVDEIDTVRIDGQTGGARGRLLSFAAVALGETDRIRGFVDADYDRLLGRELPSNVWPTDFRDLEGYLLDEECLHRVWCLALHRDDLDPAEVLRRVLSAARKLGIARLYSAKEELDLPFQNTNLQKHVHAGDDRVTVSYDSYLAALLQNAEISLHRLDEIADGIDVLEDAQAESPDRDVVHGKDVVIVVAELMSEEGVDRRDAWRILWTSFDRNRVSDYPNLREVTRFLTQAAA